MNRSFDGRKGKRSCKEEEVLEQNSATHKNKQSKRDDFEQKEVHQPALDIIDNKLHVEQDDSDVFLLHLFCYSSLTVFKERRRSIPCS
jgi:hypothetical protein